MPTRSSRNDADTTSLSPNIPDFICVYKDSSTIDFIDLKRYLENQIGGAVRIELRRSFISHHLGSDKDIDSIAEKLVNTKVFDVSDPEKIYDPFPVEIDHEKDLIFNPKKKVFGMLYNGFRLQKLLRELLPTAESSFKYLHVAFTSRPIATWDFGDGRYHARTSVYGFPSIISSSGIVEAPAKPREYYIIRKALVASGLARELVEEELKSKLKGRFIDYNDERMTDIVKGYILQAFFYHTTYEPFCDDTNCRLFNAHWQEDMIRAQLKGNDLCERHEGILEKITLKQK
ncbi:MAG: hypothetical protein JSV56_03255 [Methanomassiliicoccales archaeon]|nr:MAG: hypothetical protein JSV56_03255 [Methanomassiliicoccales archaeon]